MKRIRILDVQGRIPYPLHDGGALGMWMVTEMLGHNPEVAYGVLAMNTARHWVEPKTIRTVYGEIPHWWAPVDNRITPLGALGNLVRGTPYHISRFKSSRFARLLQRVLREFGPDVVLLEGLPVTQYVDLIRRTCPAKIVYHAHNVEHLIWSRLANAEPNSLRRAYLREQVRRLRRFERAMISGNRLDAIVTFTHVDAQALHAMGFDGPLHVKPFALRLERYSPTYAPEMRPSLFHLGSLAWEPNRQGIEWFLREVFPLVRQKIPTAEIHIAGHIPSTFRPPTTEGVHLVGPVADAREFMRSHSVLVVPLRAGSGVRVKVIEAMALGKAIVSTTIGAEGIAYTEGQDLLIADTPDAFADAVCCLLNDPHQIEALGRNARRYAERHHDTERVGNELVSFLRSVAADSAPVA